VGKLEDDIIAHEKEEIYWFQLVRQWWCVGSCYYKLCAQHSTNHEVART
jgi:hypothetical protein